MLNIPEELKNIYKNDQFPYADEVTPKDLIIYFPALDLTIETDQIVDDSFELDESLCSESDFVFGSCVAAKVKFTVADVAQDLTGQWLIINQIIEGYDPVPLGKFKVDSCVKQDNLRFKDITAYNILKDTDKDVAEWYNGLFPNGNETYTLKQFRESLLDYLGIEYENENLPNDSMIVEKTVDAGQLSAREVLRCCVELQGAFGQINRYGKFTHKILAETYTDYPQEDYPQEDYPQEEPYEQIYDSMVAQNGIKFEEYTCKPIDKLIIRQEEGDVGCIYGEGTNAYIVQGNFLLYGKSSEELEAIAANIAQNIFNREYRPFTGDLIGLPYLEVGDGVKFNINDTVVSYVLQRTLTGIQALKDELRAEGNERLEQHFGLNTEIIQLKNKSAILKRTVEELSNTITEIDGDISQLDSKIVQTATSIITEVSATYATKTALNAEQNRAQTAETNLNSKIEQTATSIRTEVSARYANKGLIPSESLAPSEDLAPADGDLVTLTEDYNSKFEQTATSISLETARAINAETQLSGRIDVMAGQIVLEATRAINAETELSGRLDVMAGQIVLKVDANGNVAAVELDADPSQGTNIKIKADNIQLEGLVTANGNFKVLPDGSIEAVNGKFSGNITGSIISGSTFISVGPLYSTTIDGGYIDTNCIIMDYPDTTISSTFYPGSASFQSGSNSTNVDASGIITPSITCSLINGGTPITSQNIGSQSVAFANSATHATYAINADYSNNAGLSLALGAGGSNIPGAVVYVSINSNFRPISNGVSSCGTSDGRWSSVWAENGTIQTSDERQKLNIKPLEDDERFLKFAKMIVPYTYQMAIGTSGRWHVGFIAQRIEEAMNECGISSAEFAGLVKAPVYAKKMIDKNGNELDEYDTSSEIIDYTYHLRYEEFIPLIFLWLRSLKFH